MSSTIAAALTVSDVRAATIRSQMGGLLVGLFLRAVAIGIGAALTFLSAVALF